MKFNWYYHELSPRGVIINAIIGIIILAAEHGGRPSGGFAFGSLCVVATTSIQESRPAPSRPAPIRDNKTSKLTYRTRFFFFSRIAYMKRETLGKTEGVALSVW